MKQIKEQNNLSKEISALKKKALHSKWQKAVTVMAALVLFCTVYAMILPAATATNLGAGSDSNERATDYETVAKEEAAEVPEAKSGSSDGASASEAKSEEGALAEAPAVNAGNGSGDGTGTVEVVSGNEEDSSTGSESAVNNNSNNNQNEDAGMTSGDGEDAGNADSEGSSEAGNTSSDGTEVTGGTTTGSETTSGTTGESTVSTGESGGENTQPAQETTEGESVSDGTGEGSSEAGNTTSDGTEVTGDTTTGSETTSGTTGESAVSTVESGGDNTQPAQETTEGEIVSDGQNTPAEIVVSEGESAETTEAAETESLEVKEDNAATANGGGAGGGAAADEIVGTIPAEEQPVDETVTPTVEEELPPEELPVEEIKAEYFTGNLVASEPGDYRVSLAITEDAEIPKNAKLKVTPIDEESTEYQDYYNKAAAELNDEIRFARFFDISILSDGEKVEPADSEGVDVTITYNPNNEKNKDITADGYKYAVHFPTDGDLEDVEILQASGAPETKIEKSEADEEESEDVTEEDVVISSADEAEETSLVEVVEESSVESAEETEEPASAEAVEAVEETESADAAEATEKAEEPLPAESVEEVAVADIADDSEDVLNLTAAPKLKSSLRMTAPKSYAVVNSDGAVIDEAELQIEDAEAEAAASDEAGMFDKEEYVDDAEVYRFSFTQSSFSVVGTVVTGSISQNVTVKLENGDDQTYNITVEGKGIPENGSLDISVIGQDHPEYSKYYEEAMAAIGKDADAEVPVRFFDITVLDEFDEVIHPEGDFTVSIKLLEDMMVSGDADIKALHFTEDEVKVIDTTSKFTNHDEETNEKSVDTVTFGTNSFSVYAIVAGGVNEIEFLSTTGNTYSISVDLTKVESLPTGTFLQVEELSAEDNEKYISEAADAIGTDADYFGYIKLLNISLIHNGEEIEPEGPVQVSIELLDKDEFNNAKVIHFGQKTEVIDAVADGSALSFETDSFSVYAVIDDDTPVSESRMTLHFYNGEELIATVYVKNADDTDAELEQIIHDPGVGDVPQNSLFKGWSLDKSDYSAATADSDSMNIAEIRAWAKQKANNNEITEGEEHNFYAMIFQTYSVAFKDEDGATIHGEALIFKPGEPVKYVVNTPYTPKDQDSQFQGWYAATVGGSPVTKEDGTEIGTAETGPIPNTTTVIIPSTTIFTPRSPKGYWLVFNSNTEDNTSRASYTPPQFVMEGTGTTAPDDPVRVGYTFDGWYRNAECTGDKFVFGQTLSGRTELYAKWKPVTQANYTVIIWQRNIDNTGYDFVESITLSGNTNTVINTVLQQGTGDSAYARVNGVNKQYQGFHLKEFDQNVTITPEGNAVLNVYYDRTEYTLRFFYARSYDITSGGGTEYYRENIGRANNGTIPGVTGNQNTTYYTSENGNTRVYWSNGYFRNQYGTRYTGSVYEQKERQTGGTTQTYIQVNVNNEGFLQGRRNNRNLNQSLTHRGSNDYELKDGSNTWKDVNNNSINGDPLNLVNNAYLNKDEVTDGSISISNVTTDVVTGNNSSSVQTVDMTYYYLDVKVRYGQSLEKLWPVPNTTFNAQTMTSYNRGHGDYTTVDPLLEGSWATGNNIGGLYGQMTTDLFVGNDTTAYFITYWRYEPHYTYQYNVYFSTLDGESPTTTYKNKGYVLQTDKSYTVANGQGWADQGAPTDDEKGYWDVGNVTFDGTNYAGRKDVKEDKTINVYYDRKIHNIIYNDGIFVNGDDGTIKNNKAEAPLKETPVLYGQDISSYAKGKEKYYEPEAPEGFVFEGWYMDSEGQQPYTFEGTMPDKDIEVYAKWRQVQYRVFLHPQVPADATNLDWGGQGMSFRVNEGEKIAGGNKIIGTADGYEFIGWYTDAACTNPFEMTAVTLNKDTVTEDYDQTDPTELDDKGNPTSAENRDNTNNRYWITKKLELYGKWRATLEGAKGINVVYTAIGDGIYGHFSDGSTTYTDPITYYLDRAEANAVGASVPNDANKYQFMYWVVQRWNSDENRYEDTDQTVYPGDTFEVLKAYARVEDIPGATDPENNKKYTVQLRAKYDDVDMPTPTHIWWYSNNGESKVVKTNTAFVYQDGQEVKKEVEELQINQAAEIKPHDTFTREGYKFLGWARVPEITNETTDYKYEEGILYKKKGQEWAELTADDQEMFLVYNSTNNTFTYNNKTVKKVAADEKNPYHDLYAVWDPIKVPLMVLKVDQFDNPLAGAEFEGDLIDGSITTSISGSGESAKAVIIDKDAVPIGEYTFREVNPPVGYIPLEGDVTIKITSNAISAKIGSADVPASYISGNATDGYVVKLKNDAGAALPMTGGRGTIPYTLIGLMLIIGSGLMYGFRMRRRERRLD